MSRRRKRLLILASLFLVVLAAGTAGLSWYLHSEHFHRWLRDTVTRALEDRFPVEVELGELRVALLGGTLEIRDLTLSSREFPADPPAVRLSEIRLNFSLLEWGSPKVRLDQLELVGLRLHLREDANDRLNLLNMFAPQPKPGGPGFSPVRLGIARILLRDALVTYDDRTVALATGSGGFDLELELDPGLSAYTGGFVLDELSLQVDDFEVPVQTVSTRFRLHDNRIDLESTEFGSGLVSGRLQGSITDLRQFDYHFETEIHTDPARFTEPDLASHFAPSPVTLTGEVHGHRGDFRWTGLVTAPRVTVEDIPLIDISAEAHIDREGIRFERARFGLFGGSAEASGQVAFQAAAVSNARLTAGGVRLDAILANWEVRFPLLAATSRIQAEVSWPGLDFAELTGQGQVTFRGRLHDDLGNELVPVQGEARVALAARRIHIEEGLTTTATATGRFQGEVDFTGSYQLSAELNWPHGDEVENVLRGWQLLSPELDQEFSPGLDGWVNATAEIQGSPDQPLEVTGTVRAAAVSLRGHSLGGLSGGYRYHQNYLEVPALWLRGPEHLVTIAFDLNLEPPAWDRVRVDLQGLEVPLLLALAGGDGFAVESGTATGSFTWSGAQDGAGQGEITIRDLVVAELSVPRIQAALRLDARRLAADRVSASVLGGEVRGQGSYEFESEQFDLEIRGERLDFGRLPWQSERFPAVGRADLDLKARGTFDNPQFDAELRSEEVRVGEYALDRVRLRAGSVRNGSDVSAEFRLFDQAIQVSGNVGFEENYPFRIAAPLEFSSLAPFFAQVRPDLELEGVDGRLSGRLTLEGTLTDLAATKANLELNQLQFGTQDFSVALDKPSRVTWSSQLIEVLPLQLVGTQTRLSLEGRLDLREQGQVNLAATGTVNLELLGLFLPEVRSSGALELETRVAGPLDNPRVVGTAKLTDGALSSPELPVEFSRGRGSFRFTANQISVDDLSLDTDFGSLNLSGGIFLDGLTPTRWQINVLGYGLAVPYPKDFNTVVDVDLDLIRNLDSYLVAGAVYVRSAEFTRNLSVAELVYGLASSQAELPSDPTFADQVSLDVSLEAYQSLRITNNLARIVGSGELSLIGTLAEPVLLGNIVIDDGLLKLEGNDYEIIRGSVSFNNPRKTTPFLNFEAETQVREYDITLSVRGPVDQFQMNFRSEPPLSTPSIVSLLAAGQTQEEIFGSERISQTESSTLMAFGAGTLLSKTLGEVVENQTSRLFGFERFSIDPFVDDTRGRDPGARITLGKQLTRELGITYISSLGNNFQDQTVIIQYQLTDWLTVVGTSSPGDGTVAVDFKFRKRF